MPSSLVIISGGQTGVDRGALDAALALEKPCGGWCPKGRLAEDGRIPDRYPLKEVSAGYPERTRRNAEDSEGTLIIHFGSLSGGTLLTKQIAEQLGKPVCLVDGTKMAARFAANAVRTFVETHSIQRLNVAGPRASRDANAYGYACAMIDVLLRTL